MPGKLQGTIVGVGDTGNLITDLTEDRLAGVPRDHSVTVRADEHETVGIHPPDHGEPEMTFLAVLIDGRLELAIVGESARLMLGLGPGQSVEIRW